MSDTWRKIIFYGGAALILGLKIFGFIRGGKAPWYLIIALGAAGVITEPTAVSGGTLQDARNAGYL